MFTRKSKSIFEEFPILHDIPKDKFPKHICIIPDGNGRWAKKNNKPVTEGHRKGLIVAEKIIRELSQIQEIKIVTLWGFSSDNWKRDAKEISGLMHIFVYVLKKVLREFNESNRKFVHLGRKDRLPKNLVDLIQKAEEETKNNTGQILAIAIDFSGEDQIIRMIQKAREFPEIAIDKESIWTLRDGYGVVRSSDLLIRTSGEMRTSDIGWLNGAPTELYVIDALFPDISTKDIVDTIVAFSQRERRFGGR